MMAPTPALRRAEAGRVGVTTPFNEQTTHLAYPGANSLDEGTRGGTFTPYFQQGERLQFSPRSSDRNFTSGGGGVVNPIYDPEEERSRLERENFDLKMQVYTLEQKVNSLEDELEGDVVQSSDDDGSVDWNNITFKEQTHRARCNGDSSHYSNAQHEEILNLRKLLENQTKISKENEDRLVSREVVLEQAYVAIEQLQVQCSTLIEEKLSIENELFSTNSKLHELEQQHTATIQRINEFSNENLRIKSELDDKTRQCIELENLRDQFEEQNLLLEEANVALAELQERDEDDKDKIFGLVSRESELAKQLELIQRHNIELSQQLTLARKDAERFQCEADKYTSTLEKTLAEISSYQDQQEKNQERESIMFQQINDLTQQKQQAENKVKSCEAKLQQCQKQIVNYEKNTLDLQQQLKEQSFIAEDKSRQQVEDLHQMLEAMQKEIEFHKSTSENRLYLLEDSERTMADLRRQVEKSDRDVKDQIKRQNEGLSQLLESAEKDAETYRTELEEQKQMFKQSQVEIQHLEEKLASKHNDYLSKQSEIERLLEQLEARLLEITDYKREIDANEMSVAHLNDKVDVLQRQLAEQKSDMAVLIEKETKDLMQQLQGVQEENQALIKDIENHHRTVADYQKKSQDLQEQLDLKELEAETLLKQRAKLLAQLKKLEENEKVHQLNISDRDQLLADSNRKVQLVQQEFEQRSHETYAHWQQQIQNTSQQLLSAQRDIKIYQLEVEERDHLLEEAAATIHKLHQQVEGKKLEADEFLQEQLQEKTDQLNSVLKDIEDLKKEITGLNQQLGDTLLLVSQLQQQLAQKDESIILSQQKFENLSSELECARIDINTFRSDMSARDKQLEDSTKSVLHMRKQLDEKVQENSELLHKMDEISHQLLSARRITETYQKDVEMQGRSLKDAAEKIEDLEKQIQACNSDKLSLQQKIVGVEDCIDSNLQLQHNVDDLSKQLASSENINKSQLEEITLSKLALDDTRAMVKDLQCQLGSYDTLFAEASELSLELESEKKRGSMYCDAIEERNKVLEEARATIQELRTRLEEVHLEANFVKGQQNSALSIRLEATQKEADLAKAQNLALWEQVSSMEKDLHRYRLDIDERDEKLAFANTAIAELHRNRARRNQEEDIVQSKIYDELSQQLEVVQRYVHDHQAEVKDYCDELANSHVEVDDLKRQLEQKRLSEEVAHMKVEDLSHQLWSSSRASEVYQAENMELQRQIRSAKNTIEELQGKLELHCENRLNEIAHKTDDSRQLFRKDYEDFELYTAAEIGERNKLLAEARETISDLKEHLQVLRKEAESTRVYNAELSTKLELAEKEVLSSRLQTLEYNERLLVLQESVHESQSLLVEKDKAFEVAQCKADTLFHQLEKVQRNMEDSYVEIKELDGKLAFSNEIIEDLEQKLKVKVQEIESVKKTNESLSEMISSAQRQVSISQEELNERNEMLAQYDSIVQDTRKQYEEQKLICAELSQQLKSLSMENSSLQSRVAEQLLSLDEVNGLKKELLAEIKGKESQLETLELNLKNTVTACTDEKSSLTISLQKALKRVNELERLVKLSKEETSKLTKQYVADLDALRIVLNDKEKVFLRLKKRAASLSQELEEKEQQLSFTLQTKDDKHSQLKELQHSFRLMKEENANLHIQIAELRKHVFKPVSLRNESSSYGKKKDAMELTLEEKLEELDLMLQGLTDLVTLSKKLTTQVKHSTRGHDEDLSTIIENDCVEFIRVNSKLSSYLQNIGVGLRSIYSQLEFQSISSKQGTSVTEVETYQRPENELKKEEKGENIDTILSVQSSLPSGNAFRKKSMNIREKKPRLLPQQRCEPVVYPLSRQNKNRETPDRFERIQAELDAISERLAKCTTEQKLLSQVMHEAA